MTREVYPLNTALSTHRKLRGWSQAKLAELIGASEEMISKWERGKKRTSPFYQEKLCALFGKNAEELGFLLPVSDGDSFEIPSTQKTREAESTRSFFPLPPIIVQPEKLSEALLFPARRQILHHLLMIGSTTLVLSPHTMLHFGDSEQPNLLGIEELEIITASYWRLCMNTSLDLLGNVSEHFRMVINLLQQLLPHRTAQRLCSLSGEIAQILGKILFDLQEHTLAWSYYMFSLKAAQAASNHDLWAVGIGRMILLLIYRKNLQNALPLLQEVHLLNLQNVRIRCWLAAVEAEVHAHSGDAQSCEVALEKAQDIMHYELLEEDRYATGFNISRLAGYEGACFVRLHQPDRALSALQRALSLLDPLAIRRQSTLLTDIGIAYAQQGDLLEACQWANKALSITEQTKSRAVLERIRIIRSELDMWKEAKEVRELEKQLALTSKIIMV